MRILKIIFFFLLASAPLVAHAEVNDRFWHNLLNTIEFAEISKASFKPACQSVLSQSHPYNILCPKLNSIPKGIINAAAIPYVKRYLSEDLANEATSFWGTPKGKILTRKIIQDIETGQFNHLTQEDLQLLNKITNTKAGQALKAFSTDKQQTLAVAKAMLEYVP